MPRTIVHGDCLAKNVHIQENRGAKTLLPFDWGNAGWGLPANDLGQLGLPYHRQPPAEADFDTYRSVVCELWPNIDIKTVRQLLNLGKMFWCLGVIGLEIPCLQFGWDREEKTIYNLRNYQNMLADSIRASELEGLSL